MTTALESPAVPAGAPTSVEITIALSSDWHTGTGFGLPGGVDALVLRDKSERAYLSGTAVTGLFQDAAQIVARALDAAETGGRWETFRQALFGVGRQPAQIRFSPAVPTAEATAGHNRANVAINPKTGRAADDMLRLTEMSAPVTLQATLELLDRDAAGNLLGWTQAHVDAAAALLAIAGGLVDRVGAERFRGAGRCVTTLLGGPTPWLDDTPPALEPVSSKAPEAPLIAKASDHAAADDTWSRFDVELVLTTPLLAQSGTRGNVIESHDHVPGTVLMAWVHRALRRAHPTSTVVRDAVVNGDLIVTAAVPTLRGARSLPVPLSYLEPKDAEYQPGPVTIVNTLQPRDWDSTVRKPMRAGFVSAEPDSDGVYAYARITPVTRMHSSFDAATRRAADAQLYTVQALPAGSALTSEILVRKRVADEVDVVSALGHRAMLGAKAKSEYGRVGVTVRAGRPARPTAAAPSGDDVLMLLTSDLVVRNNRFRPGGVNDLLGWLALRHGVDLTLAPVDGAGLTNQRTRGRRLDGWFSTQATARPSLVTLQAGTCLRLRGDAASRNALQLLTLYGLGERRAEGFGRFLLDPAQLADATVLLAKENKQ